MRLSFKPNVKPRYTMQPIVQPVVGCIVYTQLYV